jgi:hypothetical protein
MEWENTHQKRRRGRQLRALFQVKPWPNFAKYKKRTPTP